MTERTAMRLRDERGVGLAELVISMLLVAILGTIVMSAFAAFSRSFTEDRAATDSTGTASVGMNEVTRVIRSGTEIPVKNQTLNTPVFLSANKEELTLHAYLDTSSTSPKPIKVRFSINANRELVETRWEATKGGDGFWTFAATSNYSRVVARQIVVPVGAESPLFTFVSKDGATIGIPTGGITAVETLRSIAAVEVAMKVQADPTKRANPVVLRNRVGIPNLGISRLGFN